VLRSEFSSHVTPQNINLFYHPSRFEVKIVAGNLKRLFPECNPILVFYNRCRRKESRISTMEMFFGGLAFILLFIGGLLLTDYVYRAGGSMEERKAVVFEVYRYTVCLIMVLMFGMMAFQLIGSLVMDASNTQGLAGPGIGAIISGLLFFVHWFMKNPVTYKASG
jgi:hypothetical protein